MEQKDKTGGNRAPAAVNRPMRSDMVAANKYPVNDDLLDDTPEDASELDFAALLDQYNYEDPYRGQILEGVVLSASGDEVLLDVGLKQDAIVPRRDLAMLSDRVRERSKSIT